jgi:outer membrane autotransporter protein
LHGSASISESSTVDIEEDGALDLTIAFDTSVKSIEGEGVIHLGGKTLTMTDAHTTFSGLITDVEILPTRGITSAQGKLALTGGTLTLTGENSFTGGTDIEGGTMIVGSDSALGQGTVAMAEGTTLGFAADGLTLDNTFRIAGDPTFDVADGFTETISGDIGDDDPGNPDILEKTGGGTLILSGDNSYTGGTDITEGIVVVGSNTAFGTGPVAMADGTTLGFGTDAPYDIVNDFTISGRATVDFELGQDQTLSGDIADGASPGSLSKTDDGTLILSGANSYTGATVIEDGTLALSGDSSIADSSGVFVGFENTDAFDIRQTTDSASIKTLTGYGVVYIDGKTLTITDASTTFDGYFAGGGTVELTGGTLTLNGINSIGQTNVRDATLVVGGSAGNNASISDGIVDVYQGGMIAGHGDLGDLNVHQGGTIAPGSLAGGETIGTLTVNGSMTFDPSSTYEVDADPESTDSDLVHVTGVAHLGDAMVVHVGLTGSCDPEAKYTILTSDDGLDGTLLDEVTTVADSLFIDPTLTYDANNVYLQFDRNDVAFSDLGETPNQKATASGVESLGGGNPIYDAIVDITDPSAFGPIFDSLSGEVHASVKGMLIDDSRFVRNAATDRVRAAFGGVGSTTATVMAEGDGGEFVPATADTDRFAVWMRGFGSRGKWAGDGNAATLERSIGGLLFGGDGMVSENWRLGIIAGYSHSNFDVGERASSGTSDDYHLGLYGGSQWGAVGLRFGAAYSLHDIETARSVAFPGFAESLTADYDAETAQAFGELGYRIDTAGASFEPFAGTAHVNLHTDGFTEEGSAAALTSSGTNTGVAFTTLGVRASTVVPLGGREASLHGMLGWRHAFGDTTPLSRLAFAGGDSFAIAGVPIGEDAAVIEAGSTSPSPGRPASASPTPARSPTAEPKTTASTQPSA